MGEGKGEAGPELGAGMKKGEKELAEQGREGASSNDAAKEGSRCAAAELPLLLRQAIAKEVARLQEELEKNGVSLQKCIKKTNPKTTGFAPGEEFKEAVRYGEEEELREKRKKLRAWLATYTQERVEAFVTSAVREWRDEEEGKREGRSYAVLLQDFEALEGELKEGLPMATTALLSKSKSKEGVGDLPDNPFPDLVKETVSRLKTEVFALKHLQERMRDMSLNITNPTTMRGLLVGLMTDQECVYEQEERFVKDIAEIERRLATYTDKNIAAFLARVERE
jgi:hypothetical protein